MSSTATLSASAIERAQRTALICLFTGAIAIAFSPIFVRLSELGPAATAFWRVGFALPALWALMALRPPVSGGALRRPAGWRDYAALSVPGLFFTGDLICWHWSIAFTSVANSTLLANVAPLVVTLVSWLAFKERFNRTFLAGLGLAMLGALVLMGESVSLGGLDHLIGDALAVGTACFYGGYILSVGRLRTRFTTATIMTWSGAVTAATLLPVAAVSGESLLAASVYGWGILLGLALISHAGGQSLIAYALAHLPPAFSSVTLLVQPVAAAVIAWIVLNEPLGSWQAVGGAIVLGGILVARRGSR